MAVRNVLIINRNTESNYSLLLSKTVVLEFNLIQLMRNVFICLNQKENLKEKEACKVKVYQ